MLRITLQVKEGEEVLDKHNFRGVPTHSDFARKGLP
jgi:hypothetical protein